MSSQSAILDTLLIQHGHLSRRWFTLRPLIRSLEVTSRRQYSQRSSKVPNYPCRTRFAPSPTGNLHLGSLRTALFNYLLARKTNGQFILRIEDTDHKRTIPGAEKQICEDLRWAGLNWDEGPEVGGQYGPYRQSERNAFYRNHAEQLLQTGKAYRCFCTQEELQQKAAARGAAGQGGEYDGTCFGIDKTKSDERAANGEHFIVRMTDPHRNPQLMKSWNDIVRGKMKARVLPKQRSGLEVFDDAILLKSDGLPTYHLANVVDDHLMKITHVIRGVEWLESTWKHIALYEAFGWQLPEFAHVGLLRDAEGKKLSKRDQQYDFVRLKSIVFPEALMNFLALLGWRHDGPKNKDFATTDQLCQQFNMEFSLSNPVVALEKLWFLQRLHARQRIVEGGPAYDEMVSCTMDAVKETVSESERAEIGLGNDNLLRSRIDAVLKSTRNWTNAEDFVVTNECLFSNRYGSEVLDDVEFRNQVPDEAIRLWFNDLAAKAFENGLSDQPEISQESAKTLFDQCVTELQQSWPNTDESFKSSPNLQSLKAIGKALHSLVRLWLARGSDMPSTFDSLCILGQDTVRRRIRENSELYRAMLTKKS